MNRKLFFSVAAAAIFSDACSSPSASSGAPEAGTNSDPGRGVMTDAGAVEPVPAVESGSMADGGSADDSGSAQAYVRLANWTPDAPTDGYDVCLRPMGGTQWLGPLFRPVLRAVTQGGSSPAVAFPKVSSYVAVTPGTYDLQLVTAQSPDCTMGIIPLTMGLPALAAGSYTTVACVGDANATGNDASLKIAVFSDDRSAPPRAVAVRAINASPGLGVVEVSSGDVAAGTGSPLFADVAFATAGELLADGGSVDPNGYASLAASSNAVFSAQAPGSSADVAKATGVPLGLGTVVTLALVGGQNGGSPPRFLVCDDTAPASGGLTPCDLY